MENNVPNLLSLENKTGFRLKLILLIRVLISSFKGFLRDDCLMKASGISYTAIISMVPMLTVALALLTITSGFNEKQDEIFEQITTFLQKNEIKIDISPYLDTLKDLVSSATQIGAVGFVVLIFSATAILRSFEAAFNQIWNIGSPRPFLDKIIFYFFILSVGPLLSVIILGFALKLTDKLRPSHLYSVRRDSANFIWIAGERGTLIKIDESGKKLAKLSDLDIDYENVDCIDTEKKEKVKTCDLPNLKKETFIKIRNKNKNLYVLTQNGVLMNSYDGGPWKLTYFSGVVARDFSIFGDNTAILVRDNGDVFSYSSTNGIRNYNNFIVDDRKVNVTGAKSGTGNLGYLLDDMGNLWTTRDSGMTFTQNQISTLRLEDLTVVDETIMVVVGEKGSIFKSTDSGKTWQDISYENVTLSKIWSVNDNGNIVLLVLNSFDRILFSNDLGENWYSSHDPENGALLSLIPINPRFGFKTLHPEDDESYDGIEQVASSTTADLLAVGEFSKISLGDLGAQKITWNSLSGGESFFSLYNFLRLTLILVGIWSFFVMLYTMIPNVKVRVKSAMIGSLLTSIIFLLFIYGFGIYLKSFSGSTVVIYRALAAVPLFLLSIYSICLIILFGAEITATLHLKERYLDWDFYSDSESKSNNLFIQALKLVSLIYKYQIDEKTLPSEERIKNILNIDEHNYKLIKKKLLSSSRIFLTEDGRIAPGSNITDFNLKEMYHIFNGKMLIEEDEAGSSFLDLNINKQLKDLQNEINTSLEKLKIQDLIKE